MTTRTEQPRSWKNIDRTSGIFGGLLHVRPVTVLSAATGFGKTSAMRGLFDLFKAQESSAHWFDLNEDGNQPDVVHDICALAGQPLAKNEHRAIFVDNGHFAGRSARQIVDLVVAAGARCLVVIATQDPSHLRLPDLRNTRLLAQITAKELGFSASKSIELKASLEQLQPKN